MKNRINRRYAKKVKIPISIILDTIFNDDNKDVELLTRQAKKYGYVDLVEKDGQSFYQLQDDYDRQSFYTELDFDELKQYAYEDFLLSQIAFRDEKIEKLKGETEKLTKEELESQEKRRKAIEYIEEHKQKGYRTPMSDDYAFWDELNANEIEVLLSILRGDKG